MTDETTDAPDAEADAFGALHPARVFGSGDYTLRDWYWRADDGRVFSSARLATVSTDDAGLASHGARVGFVTPWPRDDAGAQTDAALDEVLKPIGLSVAGPVQTVSGQAVIDALSKAQAAACDVRDIVRLSVLADVPATNAKLARIAKAAGMQPADLLKAASGP